MLHDICFSIDVSVLRCYKNECQKVRCDDLEPGHLPSPMGFLLRKIQFSKMSFGSNWEHRPAAVEPSQQPSLPIMDTRIIQFWHQCTISENTFRNCGHGIMDSLVTEDQSNCWRRSCNRSLSVKVLVGFFFNKEKVTVSSLNIVNISLYQCQNWRTLVPIVAGYWLLVAMMYGQCDTCHASRWAGPCCDMWHLHQMPRHWWQITNVWCRDVHQWFNVTITQKLSQQLDLSSVINNHNNNYILLIIYSSTDPFKMHDLEYLDL